jgi:hypothetical protein
LRSVQKWGNAAVEYEDAAARDDGRSRFAVADGASDAYDSGRWARLLVDSFVAGEAPPHRGRDELSEWVDWLAHQWSAQIDWEELSAPRNWYKYEKASLGDFATFLCLEIGPLGRSDGDDSQPDVTGEIRWRALAVGDACLFHVRANTLLAPSFPIAASSAFDTAPPLISTQKQYNRRSLEALQIASGACQSGDWFFLATDALAHCLLAAWEQGEQPWSRLSGLTDAGFDELIVRLRRHGYLRNDDVTLLVVQIEAANEKVGERVVLDQSMTSGTVSVRRPATGRVAGQPRKRSHRGANGR